MKIFGFYSINKKYLLPLIMLAAVVFIFQGIRIPNFSSPQEPRLSRTQKIEPTTNAVIKNLLQLSQLEVVKTAQFLDCFSYEFQVKSPSVSISNLPLESHSFFSAAISTVSARAPPA